MPLYGGAFFAWILFSHVDPADYVDHGEFAIYSASLLAAALFVVAREYKVPFPERAFWVLGTAFLLVLAVLLFAGASAAVADDRIGEHVNTTAIRALSPLLLFIVVLFVFALTVRGEGLEPKEDLVTEIEAISAERSISLMDQFNELDDADQSDQSEGEEEADQG